MIKLMGKSYLVTGGAGFIASHICDELIKQEKSVICVDNLVNGKMSNIEKHLTNPLFTFLKMSICDLTPRHFNGVDVVFHNAASKFTVCRIDPKKDLMVNGWGSLNVFESAYFAGVKRVIHASSGSTLQGHPKSYYGLSKLAGETYLDLMRIYYPDFGFVGLRYYHVYGMRQDDSQRGGVIPLFIKQIVSNKPITVFGDGEQTRHFTNVSDVVKANFMAAENPLMEGHTYDVIPDWKMSILELSKRLQDVSGIRGKVVFLPIRPGEVYTYSITSEKLRDLGFSFDVSIDRGIRQLIKWYKER